MIIKTIESNSIFWFKSGVKFLMSKKIVENNLSGLIKRFRRDEGRKVFFKAERVDVVVKIERLRSGSRLKFGLDLMVDLRGSVGTGENEGSENRETDDKGKKRFVEMIDEGLVFEGHGIILTCGI